jgi:dienelactone hydrolase
MRSLLLATALAAPALLASTASASAAVTPPTPTGAAPVGFLRTTLTDHYRSEPLAGDRGPRQIPLRVWYPAARPGAQPAATLSTAEQRGWEDVAPAPPGTLDGIGSAATADAPAAHGNHPVLLMSPGLGETTALLSNHAADLASHGYVVVGLDVAGETSVLEIDGRLVRPVITQASPETIALRSRDLRFALSRLASLRGAGRLDLGRIGAFGHSNGGSTAADAMLSDHRIRAGFDLDGSIYGPAAMRGLNRPFGFMLGDTLGGSDASVTSMRSRMRAPSPFIHQPGALHHAFADNVWLVPQLGMDPVEGDVGTVDAATAMAQQNAVLRRFFDRYISG